jgi:hypothetical protein
MKDKKYLTLNINDIGLLSKEEQWELSLIVNKVKNIGNKNNVDGIKTITLSSDMPEFDIAINSIDIRESKADSAYKSSINDFWTVSFKDELISHLKENKLRMGHEDKSGKMKIQLSDIFRELSSEYSLNKTPDFFNEQINAYDYVFSFKSPIRVRLTKHGRNFLLDKKINIPTEDETGYVLWILIDLLKVFSPMFEQSIFSKPFEDVFFID